MSAQAEASSSSSSMAEYDLTQVRENPQLRTRSLTLDRSWSPISTGI